MTNGRREGIIPRGRDYLYTVRSDQWISIPTDLLGPDMEPFEEWITFVGVPLDPPMGNADTVMERPEDGEIGAEIPSRLVAFANVSAAPIKLKGDGPFAGYYDLYATLSPTLESPGVCVFHSDNGESGHLQSRASFWPTFELRPLGGGESLFADTGQVTVPGFPMQLGSGDGQWSFTPPTPHAVRSYRERGVFYHGELIVTATRGDNVTPGERMGTDVEIAKCAKTQAEFTQSGTAGRFERINFGRTQPGANIELS
jgi:hypothetical protein